jgi:hypothetical protein
MTIYPGGFWFQDHCLLIKTHSAPKIRWRYGAEPWQEIEGDNYLIEETPLPFTGGQCQIRYRCYCVWDGQERVAVAIDGKVTSIDCSVSQAGNSYSITAKNNKGETRNGINFNVYVQDRTFHLKRVRPFSSTVVDNCGDIATPCQFTVYLDGEVVYSETRDDCPQVEKLPCEANPVVSLDIETSPLGNIIVSTVALDSNGQSALDLPDGCIAVYNQIPYISIGGQGSAAVIYSFIGQFCSTPGCPPPEVLHQDGKCIPVNPCESCPDGTCAVECGDQICCYGIDGIAVTTIALADYCEG